MAGHKSKRGIRKLAHQVKSTTIHWVTHFLEFLMVLASLFWAVEARAEQSVPLKNLRLELGHSQVNPVVRSSKSVRGPASAPSSPKREGNRQLSALDLDSVLKNRIELRAPESIASGRYLPESFKNHPFYVAPSFQVLRFPGKN